MRVTACVRVVSPNVMKQSFVSLALVALRCAWANVDPSFSVTEVERQLTPCFYLISRNVAEKPASLDRSVARWPAEL